MAAFSFPAQALWKSEDTVGARYFCADEQGALAVAVAMSKSDEEVVRVATTQVLSGACFSPGGHVAAVLMEAVHDFPGFDGTEMQVWKAFMAPGPVPPGPYYIFLDREAGPHKAVFQQV